MTLDDVPREHVLTREQNRSFRLSSSFDRRRDVHILFHLISLHISGDRSMLEAE